ARPHPWRLACALAIEDDAEGHAAVLQVVPEGLARVEASALGSSPPDGDDVLEALREPRHRLVHAADLLLGEVEETLLGETLEALAVLALHVLAVELLAHERLHEVLEVAQAAGEILVEAPGRLGCRAGEAPAQLLQLRAEAPQAGRPGEPLREAPFLEAVLGLA